MNEVVAPAFGGLRVEPHFRRAVEKNDGEGEPQPAEAGRNGHEASERIKERFLDSAPAKTVGTPLGMTVPGWCGSLVAYCRRILDFGEGFAAALADRWVAWI